MIIITINNKDFDYKVRRQILMGAFCSQSDKPNDVKTQFKALFSVSMRLLYDEYSRIVSFLKQSNFFQSRSQELEDAVELYLKTKGVIDKNDMKMAAIKSTYKLHPIDYPDAHSDKEWLLAACLRQHSFVSTFPMAQLKYQNSYRHYVQFLYVCQKEPKEVIVPNKLADFMWHSHMQSPQAYIRDTTNIFGRVLNHMDDMDESTLQKYSKGTEYLMNAHLPESRRNIGIGGSSKNYLGYRHINYGKGLCGGNLTEEQQLYTNYPLSKQTKESNQQYWNSVYKENKQRVLQNSQRRRRGGAGGGGFFGGVVTNYDGFNNCCQIRGGGGCGGGGCGGGGCGGGGCGGGGCGGC